MIGPPTETGQVIGKILMWNGYVFYIVSLGPGPFI